MRAMTSSMFAAVISIGSAAPDSPSARLAASLACSRRRMPALRARFVEHVDGAVGQLVVAQVPRGQLGRGFERVVGIAHAVVPFVARAQALRGS